MHLPVKDNNNILKETRGLWLITEFKISKWNHPVPVHKKKSWKHYMFRDCQGKSLSPYNKICSRTSLERIVYPSACNKEVTQRKISSGLHCYKTCRTKYGVHSTYGNLTIPTNISFFFWRAFNFLFSRHRRIRCKVCIINLECSNQHYVLMKEYVMFARHQHWIFCVESFLYRKARQLRNHLKETLRLLKMISPSYLQETLEAHVWNKKFLVYDWQ